MTAPVMGRRGGLTLRREDDQQLHVEPVGGGASGPSQCRHNRPQLPGSSLPTSTLEWIGGPSLGGKGRPQISITPSQLEAGRGGWLSGRRPGTSFGRRHMNSRSSLRDCLQRTLQQAAPTRRRPEQGPV